MISLRYRSDIDGLRAVAVLGVVIYHAFPKVLPGGFSGVDIFFVISGYLISGILYKGHREGGFSFAEFYARRIRRLFPALIVMLIVTLGYGWMVLLPDEFRQLGKHAAAGTLFIQNFVFWQESGYFDTAANLKPLLHLWSLAVEEQFYILFPLLLVLLWKKSRILVPAMLVLLAVTFILNVVMSVQNGASDFFLTPYRAWEFLGGSLLAWWHYDRGHEEEMPFHREVMSWGGLILLGVGMAMIRTGNPYPGWRALLPVSGTLLLIEGGAGAWINRNVLSHRAVVWIGLISYPLYLFHWPVLSFVHIVEGKEPKVSNIFLAIGVALLLALLTYQFVEKKLRHNKSNWTVPALILAFLSTGLISSFIWQGWIPVKCTSISKGFEDAIEASLEASTPKESQFLKASSHTTLYRLGKGAYTTLFVGDSNMEQYAPRIERLASASGNVNRSALMLWSGGVPPIPEIGEDKRPGSRELLPMMDKLLEKDSSIDRVVFGADWVLYCCLDCNPYMIHGLRSCDVNGQQAIIAAMQRLVERVVKRRKSVFVVMNIPIELAQDPKSEIGRGYNGIWRKQVQSLQTSTFDSLYGKFLHLLGDGCRKAGAVVIDPLPFFAKDNQYPRMIDGKHLYRDGGHLRASYVREGVTYLDQTMAP